ncbi:MAG: ATP-dependent Clp protease adaptor ClpS [Campylobacterales bacterium]|nr:ATP-dependent Clp protease adaptor ClpS [Campylobacterales bacterium]
MEDGFKHDTEEDIRTLVEPPKKYKVIMHNDDYSTWEFVIDVLKQIFHKTEDNAINITQDVHNKGKGVCGVYSYEIAEMKVSQVHSLSKANGFPLKCTIEEE